MQRSWDTYLTGSAVAGAAVRVNLLLAVSCPPLLLLALLGGSTAAWPAVVLSAPLGAPAVCAAFALFAELSADPTAAVTATFLREWRRTWRPATAVAGLGCAAGYVLATDVRLVWGRPVGALAIPFFTGLLALVVITTTVSLVAVAELPATGITGLLRTSAVLAVRRWHLSALSLLVLSLLVGFVAAAPVLGLGVAVAPALYLVWANSRHTLRPVRGGSPPPAVRPEDPGTRAGRRDRSRPPRRMPGPARTAP